MADITFRCPHCGQELDAPDDMIGEMVDCPNSSCLREFRVPAPPSADGSPTLRPMAPKTQSQYDLASPTRNLSAVPVPPPLPGALPPVATGSSYGGLKMPPGKGSRMGESAPPPLPGSAGPSANSPDTIDWNRIRTSYAASGFNLPGPRPNFAVTSVAGAGPATTTGAPPVGSSRKSFDSGTTTSESAAADPYSTPNTDKLSQTSLILGILSWVCCAPSVFVPLIGILIAIGLPVGAIITGHMARSRIVTKGGDKSKDTKSKVGLLLGYSFFLVGIMSIIVIVIAAAMKNDEAPNKRRSAPPAQTQSADPQITPTPESTTVPDSATTPESAADPEPLTTQPPAGEPVEPMAPVE